MAKRRKRKAKKSSAGKPSNDNGRPSKYKPRYCQDIVKFFSGKPYKETEVTYSYKNGDTKTVYEDKANDPPFFSGFARKIGVNTDTIVEWEKKHKEFSAAYKKAKDLQKEFLVVNGLKGTYQTAFAIFTMKNLTDWRNKDEIEHSGHLAVTVINKIPRKNGQNHSK